jgi:predicted nucleic acid-binding protein
MRIVVDTNIVFSAILNLTEQIKGRLWSGDKELQKGLEKKNWNRFISTEELFKKVIRRIK